MTLRTASGPDDGDELPSLKGAEISSDRPMWNAGSGRHSISRHNRNAIADYRLQVDREREFALLEASGFRRSRSRMEGHAIEPFVFAEDAGHQPTTTTMSAAAIDIQATERS